jgi:hypothetical protein
LMVCRCSPRSSLGGDLRGVGGLTAAARRRVGLGREEPRGMSLPMAAGLARS